MEKIHQLLSLLHQRKKRNSSSTPFSQNANKATYSSLIPILPAFNIIMNVHYIYCCHQDLQKAAKIVAVFHIFLSTLELIGAMVFESGAITTFTTDTVKTYVIDVNYLVTIELLIGITLVIIKIIQLCFSIVLLHGVIEKDYRKCGIWYLFSWFFMGLASLHIIFELLFRDELAVNEEINQRDDGNGSYNMKLHGIIIPCFEIILNVCLMCIIHQFMIHIKWDREMKTAHLQKLCI